MTKSKLLSEHNAINLVIFDCDGVLVDSEILSQRVLLSMLKELGVVASEGYFLTNFLGFNFEHVTAKVLTDYGVTITSEFRQRYREALIEVFAQELQKTEKLDWLLSQLNVESCVATSGSPEKVKHSLHYTKLEQYFDGKVFTSSEVKNGKPAPDLFLHAAKKMGVSPENCLVIEDSSAGIRAGLAAKMQVIRYVGASHLKNKDITTQIAGDFSTIGHWNQLFEQVPSLSSSLRTEK